MRIVQRYGDIEHMAAHHTPRCVIIRGGDEYLNRLAARRTPVNGLTPTRTAN